MAMVWRRHRGNVWCWLTLDAVHAVPAAIGRDLGDAVPSDREPGGAADGTAPPYRAGGHR